MDFTDQELEELESFMNSNLNGHNNSTKDLDEDPPSDMDEFVAEASESMGNDDPHHPEAFQYDINGNLIYAPQTKQPSPGAEHDMRISTSHVSNAAEQPSSAPYYQGNNGAPGSGHHSPMSPSMLATSMGPMPLPADGAVMNMMPPPMGPNGEILPMYMGYMYPPFYPGGYPPVSMPSSMSMGSMPGSHPSMNQPPFLPYGGYGAPPYGPGMVRSPTHSRSSTTSETVHSLADGFSNMKVGYGSGRREMCRKWPNCSYGDRCRFYHPPVSNTQGNMGSYQHHSTSTQLCRNFPNCSFGKRCRFVHPGPNNVPPAVGAHAGSSTSSADHAKYEKDGDNESQNTHASNQSSSLNAGGSVDETKEAHDASSKPIDGTGSRRSSGSSWNNGASQERSRSPRKSMTKATQGDQRARQPKATK